MEPLQFSMLMHFLGIGIVFAALIAGWLVNASYRKAEDYRTKAIILRAMRPIGLLLPVAITVLLATGIANMSVLAYGWFTTAWLSAKVALFLVAAAAGVVFGIGGARRTRLVAQIAEGSSPGDAENTLRRMDGRHQLFYIIQSLLILAILGLSVYKPGQYGT